MLRQKESVGTEDDFNLYKFRSSLYLRISSPYGLKMNSVRKDDNSVQKSVKNSLHSDIQHRKSVPSFDELLKTMNSSVSGGQSLQSSNHKRNVTDSFKKINGLQNKIDGIGNQEVSQIAKLSQPFIQNKPIPLPNNSQQKRTTFSSSLTEKPVFTKGNGKCLMDKLSLKELMELRSKIDNSTQSEVHQLSANYVQELIKLSQIITKQVKQVK